MKTQNKIILMSILIFTGITLNYSQGWAFSSSAIKKLERISSFTCEKQGPDADMTVEVLVRYNQNSGKPVKVWAVEKIDDDYQQELKFRKVIKPYFFGKEKNPTDPTKPKSYAFQAKDTGPPPGATICTKNNYPVFVYSNKAWFFFK